MRLIAIIILFISQSLCAQVTYNKTVTKKYKTDLEPELSIINKYGKVHIEKWDVDSIYFIIKVEMRSKNHLKLSKMKSTLDFDFDKSGQYITAITSIKNSGPIIISDLSELISKDDKLQIDYTVKVPNGTILNIDNKYGNVYLPTLTKRAQVKISHGDLRVNSVKVNCDFDIHFGDASFKNFEKGRLSISYGNCKIRKAGSIKIKSKSSSINVTDAKFIRFDSKRDRINIENIKTLKGDFDYSKVYIHNLEQTLNTDMKFGEIKAEQIKPSFGTIDINSRYTDIELVISSSAAYNLELTHRKVDTDLPNGTIKHSTKFIDKHEFEYWTGTIGTDVQNRKVSILAENSEIIISK